LISLDWLLRGLLGLGGTTLVYVALPVSKGAWQAQYSDAVVTDMRLGHAVALADVVAAIAALDRAVAADPTAGRLMQRSELLAGAALVPELTPSAEQRTTWLKRAQTDLEAALGDDPGRGLAWMRLATVRTALDGPSQQAVAPLLMSIDTAPLMSPLWPARLQLILDNWQALTPAQRDEIGAHVARIWRLSADRRWVAAAIRSPIDELFVRYFLRDEANAEAELTQLLAARKK
jgi:hypothetical protein